MSGWCFIKWSSCILCWWSRLCGGLGYSLVAQTTKPLPATRETQAQSLGWEDPLKKEIATHSSCPWKIPWTEEPGRLWSMWSQRVGHGWATSLCTLEYSQLSAKEYPAPLPHHPHIYHSHTLPLSCFIFFITFNTLSTIPALDSCTVFLSWQENKLQGNRKFFCLIQFCIPSF